MAAMVARAADGSAARLTLRPGRQRPLPRRPFERREPVVVAARQCLERHEGRGVLEIEPEGGRPGKLPGSPGALDPPPTAPRPGEPGSDPHGPISGAQILHGDEFGEPSA